MKPKVYYAKYRLEHRNIIRENSRRFREANKEKLRIYAINLRHKKYFSGMRQFILERDNFQCRKCGMNNEEHKKAFGMEISIDHIDKNKLNNKLENLITLCLSCHSKKEWIIWRKERKIKTLEERKKYKHDWYIKNKSINLLK